MKKLLTLVALVSLFAVSNASAFWGRRGGDCCRKEVRTCAVAAPCVEYKPTIEAPAPICEKTVSNVVRVAPRKICQTSCHYVCPPGYDERGCENGNDSGY